MCGYPGRECSRECDWFDLQIWSSSWSWRLVLITPRNQPDQYRKASRRVSSEQQVADTTNIYQLWLVVWNIFYFAIYWESHHPNWRTHIFQMGSVGQPPTRTSLGHGNGCINRRHVFFRRLPPVDHQPGAVPGCCLSLCLALSVTTVVTTCRSRCSSKLGALPMKFWGSEKFWPRNRKNPKHVAFFDHRVHSSTVWKYGYANIGSKCL